jgi:hypothetical protein
VLLFYPFVKKERMRKMKKTMQVTISVVLVICCLLGLTACGKPAQTGLWANATYTEDTQLGEGTKTVVVEVTAEEKTVTFTVKTDEKTVGAALLEQKLIAGDQSEYGLYIKTVNGIIADYDVDQTYWAFYVNGEYAMTGVDATEIAEGVTYQLVRSK